MADLPLGLAVLAVFHLVLRAPLTALAPDGLRARLPDRVALGIAVVPALLLGVATHLVWDGFTQVGGFAVTHWPVMRIAVAGPHRLFNVAMYVSSAGGLAVLGWWVRRWYGAAPVRPGRWPGVPSPVRRWVGAACALAALTGATVMANGERAAVSLYDLVRCVLLGGTVGAGAVLICYVAAWHATRLRRTVTS